MPTRTIEAIFEKGVFRPLHPLRDIAEHDRVSVTITYSSPNVALSALFGTLPDEDAREMLQIVEREFEQIDANDWK
jgi:predicted DNA-binding antitoxin AbrB/MazE fold protein